MRAIEAIRKVIHPAVADDFELEQFLVKRAYNLGVPLNNLRGKNQTVAILGEGMKISRELATAAQNATGI